MSDMLQYLKVRVTHRVPKPQTRFIVPTAEQMVEIVRLIQAKMEEQPETHDWKQDGF